MKRVLLLSIAIACGGETGNTDVHSGASRHEVVKPNPPEQKQAVVTKRSVVSLSRKSGTNGDPIEQALTVLTEAVESIDTEVADAKTRADEAKAEYEHLRDTAKERKAAIQAKIDALNA